MVKEKQRGTVADKGKKKITTTGKGQENSCPSVPVLRERNIGVVIRDEQDINLMRLRAVILQAKAGFFVYTALDVFPGDTTTYFAVDKMSFDDAHDRTITIRYPNEYLNSLNPSGLPPFKLDLKVSCPIMLLRNIAPKAGLCNGTRLMIVNCANSIIETQILTGDKFGDLVFIPRISLTPSSSEMPFEMTRRQFPIRLAYAMTINKSQGQSVNFVGIDLRTPVFSHGQLYVALSRCTFDDRTSVLLFNDVSRSTTNIVYPEVLL